MPVISNVRLHQLEEAERRLKQQDIDKAVKWIGRDIGKALAMILANKPYSKWTEVEKQILKQVCGYATVARTLYIEQLPLDPLDAVKQKPKRL